MYFETETATRIAVALLPHAELLLSRNPGRSLVARALVRIRRESRVDATQLLLLLVDQMIQDVAGEFTAEHGEMHV